MKKKYIWKIKIGHKLLPERRRLLSSQEIDHIKVLKGEMGDIEYYKKWENFKYD